MIASRHIQFLVVCLGSIVALYVGSNIVTLPPAGLMIVLATLFTIIWMLMAGANWWVPFLSGAVMLGTFYVGVKVYPIEVAFALCITGLVPLFLVQDKKAFQAQRKKLPIIFYLTATYLIIRLLIDVIPASGAHGSMSRLMFGYVAWFVFAYLFHNYGSLSVARTAVGLMFALLFVRTTAALAGFFLNIPMYIPGINYVLSFSSSDSLVPMRIVAAAMLFAALILFHASKSLIAKALLLPVFAFSGVLVIMGAGRFQTLATLFLPIAFFAWSRRWIFLLISLVVGAGMITIVNLQPELLHKIPTSAGRALSGLVFDAAAAESDNDTGGSNEWHDAMRDEGLKRWLTSPKTILFGYGISPSPDLYSDLSFKKDPQVTVENAANIGAYESGLFNVISVVGAVGFGLYLALFFTFWKAVIPWLFKKPVGTFWEGMVFWGCFASITWFAFCYFQGSTPGFEMVLLIMAWDIINEGKLDEEAPVAAPVSVQYRAPLGLANAGAVHARG